MDERPTSERDASSAEEERDLRQWFDQYGPPTAPEGWRFDWDRWESRGREKPVRASQRGWWAAALLAVLLGGIGYGVHQMQQAAMPPLPFPVSSQPASFQLTMLTTSGGAVRREPLGGQAGASVASRSPSPGLSTWSGLSGLSAARTTAAYDVSGVQLALAADGSRQVALVIPKRAGMPSVWNITRSRKVITPVKTNAQYAVYLFPGPAGAAKVVVGGHTVQFSWVESGARIPGVGSLLGSAWNLGPSTANGPGGAHSYALPPAGGGRGIGVTPDGVVWLEVRHAASTIWLLPAVGPRIPLLRIPAPVAGGFAGIINMQANDPTHLGVLLHLIKQGPSEPDYWWNLGTGQYRALPVVGTPVILLSNGQHGWISGMGQVMEVAFRNGAPDVVAQNEFLGVDVQGTTELGSTVQHRNVMGTFNWVTKHFTPAKVTTVDGVSVNVNTPATYLPGWGFTYALYPPNNGSLGQQLILASINGQHRYQEALASGASIYIAPGFLVKTVPGSKTFWIGEVGAGNRFHWTALGQGQPWTTWGSVIWVQSGRTWALAYP